MDRIHGTLSRIGPTATVHLTAELRCVRMIIARCSSLLLLCSLDPSIRCSFSSCFRVGRRVRGGWPEGRHEPDGDAAAAAALMIACIAAAAPSPGTRRIIHSDP